VLENMTSKLVFNLPQFDTGKYEDCEFVIKDANATLTIHIYGLSDVVISFTRVRWHQFTALYNCDADMIQDSYFKLVEVSPFRRLDAYIKNDRAPAKAYKSLHHYRIFLDETGCHEVFAEAIST
jgi:hypothetical protein